MFARELRDSHPGIGGKGAATFVKKPVQILHETGSAEQVAQVNDFTKRQDKNNGRYGEGRVWPHHGHRRS